jgi:hypothetical protein
VGGSAGTTPGEHVAEYSATWLGHVLTYILFIGIRTLCDCVTRGYGDYSPLTP